MKYTYDQPAILADPEDRRAVLVPSMNLDTNVWGEEYVIPGEAHWCCGLTVDTGFIMPDGRRKQMHLVDVGLYRDDYHMVVPYASAHEVFGYTLDS